MNLLDLSEINMLKINKNWFSFIELIIVISIIAIISVFWISSFSDQIDSLKAKNVLSEVSYDIKDLDNKVANREIFDYELEFIKNKKYYLVNENIFDQDFSLKLDNLNDNTWIWEISFSGVIFWSWIIKYYEDIKFQKLEEIAYNKSFTWVFNKAKNYKITWSFSGSVLNTLFIKYFDLDKNYKLIRIDPNIWPDLPQIKLKNILWKKQFWNNSSINKIVLTFEDELGKSETLEMLK